MDSVTDTWYISCYLPRQVIETLRATDLDSLANGRLSFFLPAEHPVNPHFTVRDNGGETASQTVFTCTQVVY